LSFSSICGLFHQAVVGAITEPGPEGTPYGSGQPALKTYFAAEGRLELAVVLESQWDAGCLAGRLQAILASPSELHRLREGAAAWSNTDAALHVVRACERLLLSRESARHGYGSADSQN
jgi:hypothetical protein